MSSAADPAAGDPAADGPAHADEDHVDHDRAAQVRRARRQSWFGAKKHVKTTLSHPLIHPLLRLAAPRMSRERMGRLPAPRELLEVKATVADGEFVMLRPDRCEVAKELYWGEGRRPDPADAFAIDLVVRLSADARTFLDVGAYTGIFTLATVANHPTLSAHAFDMVPPVVRMLRANLVRNGFANRTAVHQAGVGDPSLTARMPSVDSGSALPSFLSSDMEFDDGEDVGFLSLDSFTVEVEGPVVMKIDVEGGETDVFAHGQSFLAAHRPDMLCEVLPDGDGPTLEEQLQPHGYRYFHVGADEVSERSRIVPDPGVRDWLFTTRTPDQLRDAGIPVAED